MKKQKIVSYIVIIVSILIVAGLGSVFVNLGIDWFNTLNKPSQFVPNWLIPVVWSVIYAIFAIVLCLWVSKKPIPKNIIWQLVINGVFNILWCLTFFTLNLTFLGNVTIVLLLIMAYVLIISINKYEKTYSYFTAIYPIWVSIATTLNMALWILN